MSAGRAKVPAPPFVIIPGVFHRILRAFEIFLAYVVFAALFTYSNPPLTDRIERVRAFTREREFNYISWTLEAARVKLQAASIGLPHILDRAGQKRAVMDYLQITQRALELEYALEQAYADAAVVEKEKATEGLRLELRSVLDRQRSLTPFAESVLQEQISVVLSELGLTVLGQPLPSVFFHSTPLPYALIVSPREKIEQIANISVDTDITVDEQAALEGRVDQGLEVSSLVVPIGGVGVYPTMVQQTTNLSWMINTISHEWIHNYLTLRPLGIYYVDSPELRTMNETTASIAGDEIGNLVMERYYPELVYVVNNPSQLISDGFDHPEPGDFLRPVFDFRAEMHETRVTVDSLLEEGNIEQAEAYMESRRSIFLKNGFLLRKINQAYFAFYGAYADVPGGAAGEDPVGPAVRSLRAQSDSLAEFLHTISWMTSFEQLEQAVGNLGHGGESNE